MFENKVTLKKNNNITTKVGTIYTKDDRYYILTLYRDSDGRHVYMMVGLDSGRRQGDEHEDVTLVIDGYTLVLIGSVIEIEVAKVNI